MRYLSVCSGIEAATVAWHPLGWEAAAYSEIEKFPSAVLAHHYPTVPNLGDMTKFKEWELDSIDLLVGGTPCQSFSVAGLRKGLEDPRGNLALVYCGILDRFRPQWFVWENVPGVLSSNSGRDFGSFLGALAELGYGFAYRVLDAQYFGVAQRRRRVFVVGYFGDWRPAAEVLFEPESVRGDPAPSRKAREGVTASVVSGAPVSDYDVAGTLDKGVPRRGIGHNGNYDSQVVSVGSLCARTCQSISVQDATQGHLMAQPIALAENTIGRKPENGGNGVGFTEGGSMYTLNATGVHGVAHPVGLDEEQNAFGTLKARTLGGGFEGAVMQSNLAVRRLTCVECERLQGFPDGYTDIQLNDKDTPDSPRYKVLGNSMAVPVMQWIGKRINNYMCGGRK